MARTVYPTAEIPHLFAANRDAEARTSSHNLRCGNGVLWNYQQPIAAYFGDTVLISSDSFSVTTSRHQRRVRYATRHLRTLSAPDLKSLVQNPREADRAAYIADRIQDIADIQTRMGRMRSEWKKDSAQGEINSLERLCQFIWNEHIGKRSDWRTAGKVKEKADRDAKKARYTHARNVLESAIENASRIIADAEADSARDVRDWPERYSDVRACHWNLDRALRDCRYLDSMGARNGLGDGSSATFRDAAAVMGKKWARECTALAKALDDYLKPIAEQAAEAHKAWLAIEATRNAEHNARWLAGENVHPRGETVLCRVVGDVVETSKGARVPLHPAIALARLAEQCRAKGTALDLGGRQIGPYRANRISAAGDLTVGCHFIPYASIADCVARYEASREGVTA